MTYLKSAPDDPLYWLDSAPNISELGGKARMLGRLIAAGLPVPLGFVLSADVFPADPPVSGVHLPPDVAVVLRRGYDDLARLVGTQNPLVAVRSSAVAEDLAEASFAGQYVTVLGVRGIDEVIVAAERCWASLWSPSVVAYREAIEHRTGKSLPPPGMAIIVQVLVPATVAGVADTADSFGGNRTEVTISAAWGLGRSVVDGAVQPDYWRIARDGLHVLEKRVGDKISRALPGLDDTSEPISDELRHAACLSDEQAQQVAALALQAEVVVGGPADVEWAFADDRLWLLQARPLTGMSKVTTAPTGAPVSTGPAPAFPFVWSDAVIEQYHWSSCAPDQRSFEAYQPFEIDARYVFINGIAKARWLFGAKEIARAIDVNGYMYDSLVPVNNEAERKLREETFTRRLRVLHDKGESLQGSVLLPEAQAILKRVAPIQPDNLSTAELADHMDDMIHSCEQIWVLHFTHEPWDELSPIGRCTALYKQITGDDNPWAIYIACGDLPTPEIEAVEGLIALTRIVHESPALRQAFEELTPDQLWQAVQQIDAAVTLRETLTPFLQTYALHCGASWGVERNQVMPGWGEKPELVMALMQAYMRQDLDALMKAHAKARQGYIDKHEQLRAQVTDKATPDQLKQFTFWYDAATQVIDAALRHNLYMDSPANSLLHRALMACGRRLAQTGVIDAPEDAWFMRAHQISAALRTLDDAVRPDWRKLISANKALLEWQRTLNPPPYLGAPPPPPDPSRQDVHSEQAELPMNLLVKGEPAVAGKATGRVRLVDNNDLVPNVRAGDVFVSHNCGALWGTVMPAVSAVVVDGSSPHEHAMRICREFGIPAIVQTGNATSVLREGQRVTVDGTRGWVLATEEIAD